MKQALVKQTAKSTTMMDKKESQKSSPTFSVDLTPSVSLTNKRRIDRKTLLKIIQKVEQL